MADMQAADAFGIIVQACNGFPCTAGDRDKINEALGVVNGQLFGVEVDQAATVDGG
jgi:hypothetical protein